MTQLFANAAISTLAAGIGAGDLSLTVAAGTGALFPSPTGGDYFLVTIEAPTPVAREIVKVTARTGDVFTIVRAQEGTSAAAWALGDVVENRETAGTLAGFAAQGLPAWWTVDSTPGSEVVEFAGEVHVTPSATGLYGLLIQPEVGFYNNYNAFIRVLDENGIQIFNVDSGGFDMAAPPGQESIHVLFQESDTINQGSLSSRALNLYSSIVGSVVVISREVGLRLGGFTPSEDPDGSTLQIYFDPTNGAAKVKFKGKSANGTVVTGEVALT